MHIYLWSISSSIKGSLFIVQTLQEYIKESDNLVSLHEQIRDCDNILSQMETLLSGFQVLWLLFLHSRNIKLFSEIQQSACNQFVALFCVIMSSLKSEYINNSCLSCLIRFQLRTFLCFLLKALFHALLTIYFYQVIGPCVNIFG